MLAAITRSYATPVPQTVKEMELPPFVLNLPNGLPKSIEEYLCHAKAWRKENSCPSLIYEYHFFMNQYRDMGVLNFAKIIYDDIHGYRANGFDGIIEDGSQRSYFPNGFLYYVYAETLFDNSVKFEDLVKDYFESAYGEIAENVVRYLYEISEAFNMRYQVDAARDASVRYNPEQAEKLRGVKDIVAKFAPTIEKYRVSPYRARTVAMRLLKHHAELCVAAAEVWEQRALGKNEEAFALFEQLRDSFGRLEYEIGL